MEKILFIDRDGTIIIEPPTDYQVDSLEKLEFLPKAIRNLYKIQNELGYKLVMVTNQDGLGTDSFPEETFWLPHNKMMTTLESEGITFEEVLIDPTFPEENSPNRKPNTGLLTHYIKGPTDLSETFVIGDRYTDIELAKNLGAKGIQIAEQGAELAEDLQEITVLQTLDWDEIYEFLKGRPRTSSVVRNTKETKINIRLDLDGTGQTNISTGLSFFDHMLDQIGRHSGCDLFIKVDGDLEVDQHHTMEDTALALGEAFKKALGDKRGIERYGFLLPMDDCLAQVGIDFGGRPWIVWDAEFKRENVGDVPTEMFFHFFKSFSDTAACNLNIKAEGENEHHKIEAIFKGLARAIKMAIRQDKESLAQLPSTKGVL